MPNLPEARVAQVDDTKVTGTTVKKVESQEGLEAYAIKKSASQHYYVDAKEYDPLAKHRSREKDANKGEGMTFMCCCLARPKVQEAVDRDHGVDRKYSMRR